MTSGQQRRAVENAGGPAYLQIARILGDDIESGALQPGDQLPSTAELSEEFKVSPNVVKSAVSILRTQGLVVGMQGKGVFVTNPDERPQPPEPAGDELVAELRRMRQTVAELGERIAAIEAAVFGETPQAR